MDKHSPIAGISLTSHLAVLRVLPLLHPRYLCSTHLCQMAMAPKELMSKFEPTFKADPALLVMINVKPFMAHDAEVGSNDQWLAGFPDELLIVLQKN